MEQTPQDDIAFHQFLTWLRQRCQLDWSQYRQEYLKRRIESCMATMRIPNYGEYIKVLERDPSQLQRLRDGITINVTEFFRDATTFDVLKQIVIPEVAASKQKAGVGLVRVWSAGCATGEETYSIALSFLEVLGADLSGLWLSVYGTDVDEECLRNARAGVYGGQALTNVPSPLVEQYFVAKEQGTFTAGEKLRSLVHFQQLDLIHDTPLKHLDIVFCRYVFIYMSRELQESALRAFHGALNRNRFLILGRTESMPVHLLDRLFASVNPEERVYRKLTEGS